MVHLLFSSAFLVLGSSVHGFTAHLPFHCKAANLPRIATFATTRAVAEPELKPESEVLHSILSSQNKTYHSLKNLTSYRSWDFSWPTITKPHRFTERNTYATDTAFFTTLQNHNSGLSFDLLTAVGAFDEVNDVVLYGGALVDIVRNRDWEIRDFDFRLVGEQYVGSPDKCIEAATGALFAASSSI